MGRYVSDLVGLVADTAGPPSQLLRVLPRQTEGRRNRGKVADKHQLVGVEERTYGLGGEEKDLPDALLGLGQEGQLQAAVRLRAGEHVLHVGYGCNVVSSRRLRCKREGEEWTWIRDWRTLGGQIIRSCSSSLMALDVWLT